MQLEIQHDPLLANSTLLHPPFTLRSAGSLWEIQARWYDFTIFSYVADRGAQRGAIAPGGKYPTNNGPHRWFWPLSGFKVTDRLFYWSGGSGHKYLTLHTHSQATFKPLYCLLFFVGSQHPSWNPKREGTAPPSCR